MSKSLELTGEQYSIISEIAKSEGQTPEELFLRWAMDEETRYRQAHPTHYETDDWLRHLGVSEERIQRANAGYQ
jgi:diketogulonate reductase-like aldo/keto reductase